MFKYILNLQKEILHKLFDIADSVTFYFFFYDTFNKEMTHSLVNGTLPRMHAFNTQPKLKVKMK